jgi:hypothetical protein
MIEAIVPTQIQETQRPMIGQDINPSWVYCPMCEFMHENNTLCQMSME